MELSKQRAEVIGADTDMAPEPRFVAEPPTAEELDRERNRSRLKPLDGGRAMAVLGPMVWAAGILIAVAATVMFLGPFMLFFVLLLGGPELYHRFKNRHSEESRDFHSVSTRTKVAVAAVYLSLAAMLVVGVAETYVHRAL